ncbi:ACT domain-containing protein [Brevibacillus sp. SYP-B805]|uniref:ACT domain-containing protein n=1 Tax=Brevibacillus sp. SYP-B805 TaxID=1578199 RepID=UPI0013EC1E91|nr:ACT domain-containing protein [Brevibacillus sp. SYP-B805]NGQ96246.1 ACT domain-containing protein [Brevibacillus sp. SYP-B805]
MTDTAGLRSLGRLIHRFEARLEGATLTILSHENRDDITRALLEGLGENVAVQASSGEYTNHLATLKVNGNKYTFARDYRETYISEINYCPCRITPEANGVVVDHIDYPGVIYDVSRILAENRINISKLNVAREQKGRNALLISLTDEEISADVVEALEHLPQITRVISLR